MTPLALLLFLSALASSRDCTLGKSSVVDLGVDRYLSLTNAFGDLLEFVFLPALTHCTDRYHFVFCS
jgi:hypothetical protein